MRRGSDLPTYSSNFACYARKLKPRQINAAPLQTKTRAHTHAPTTHTHTHAHIHAHLQTLEKRQQFARASNYNMLRVATVWFERNSDRTATCWLPNYDVCTSELVAASQCHPTPPTVIILTQCDSLTPDNTHVECDAVWAQTSTYLYWRHLL